MGLLDQHDDVFPPVLIGDRRYTSSSDLPKVRTASEIAEKIDLLIMVMEINHNDNV